MLEAAWVKMKMSGVNNEPISILLNAESVLDSVGTFIFVFTSGEEAFHSYEPLPRSPLPEVNWLLDQSLKDRLLNAFEINPSIHDGAMVFKREEDQLTYLAAFWSCRLLPPKTDTELSLNLGVAWNSCLAMSSVVGVDFVVLYSKSKFTRFDTGVPSKLEKILNEE